MQNNYFRKSFLFWDIVENIVEQYRPQMTIWRKRFA